MFDFDMCRTFDFLTVRNKRSIIQERSEAVIFTTSGTLKRNGTPVLTASGVFKNGFTA